MFSDLARADIPSILGYGNIILAGAAVTVQLTIGGCAVALLAAFTSGLSLLSKRGVVRGVARTYVEFFRGTSVFVQLFWAYFVLPIFGLDISAIQASILALGLNGGAYGAEVVRAGIKAVGRDQRDACVALNLTRWQSMRSIILPQAVAVMLPSFGNLSIEIMKGTAAASLISVSEMTFQAQLVRSQTGVTAFPFLTIFCTYFLVASALASCVQLLERRMRRGLDGVNL
jgi:polar amino acid transport system permease protein